MFLWTPAVVRTRRSLVTGVFCVLNCCYVLDAFLSQCNFSTILCPSQGFLTIFSDICCSCWTKQHADPESVVGMLNMMSTCCIMHESASVPIICHLLWAVAQLCYSRKITVRTVYLSCLLHYMADGLSVWPARRSGIPCRTSCGIRLLAGTVSISKNVSVCNVLMHSAH